jgi:DNA-binding CsgD family transcriptional regulator
MARLPRRHLQTVLECIAQLYSEHDLERFPRHVLRVVRGAAPVDFAVYDELDLRRRRHRWVSDPVELDLGATREAHAAFFREHPFVRHLGRAGDLPPSRLSDFLSRRRYHETALYREAYRAFGVEHQLGFALPALFPRWSVGLALNRSRRDFSDEERLVFEVLRPHLVQAHRNAQLVTRLREAAPPAAPEAAPSAVVRLDARRRLPAASPGPGERLGDYLGPRAVAGGNLPDAVRRWLDAHRLPATAADRVPVPCPPLVLERPGRRLILRKVGDSGAETAVAIDERATTGPVSLGERLGLTRRQAEILLWVARGKTNPEIATILGLSPHTVHKHTEHVFARLGVETRTAAAARAWEMVTGRPLDGSS